jgi:hypothetical protein
MVTWTEATCFERSTPSSMQVTNNTLRAWNTLIKEAELKLKSLSPNSEEYKVQQEVCYELGDEYNKDLLDSGKIKGNSELCFI